MKKLFFLLLISANSFAQALQFTPPAWLKINVAGESIKAFGPENNDKLIFGSNGQKVGEYNSSGKLYGWKSIGINSGFNDYNYQSTMGYHFVVGGKAAFGYHTNMPTLEKSGTYFLDIAKQYTGDISQIRFTKWEASGIANVPKWYIEHGNNNDFSIKKVNTNFSIDTTNSFYINSGRFNFGRSTGLNNSKFTFGGSMTILGALNLENYKTAGFIQTDANGLVSVNSTLQTDIDGKVSIATPQNITGIKTFQHNTASYMGYFNNTNMNGKGVKFINSGIFPAIEVWQDLGSTPGVQLWANGDGDFDGYLRSRYFQMSTGGGAGKIMQSNGSGFGSWIDPITLPIPTLVQTDLNGKAGLSSNNNFTGTNTFLTPVFANSTSTSSFSSITGAWNNTGNLGIFSFRYNTKFGGNTVTWNPIRMDYNGQVGIGMDPTVAFEVLGFAKFNSTISATSISASGGISANSFSSTNGVNFATGSGNVGIGTISPIEKLDLNGGFRISNGANPYIGLNNGTNISYMQVSSNVFNFTSSNPIGFNTGGNERLRINTDGKTGIGTANPQEKLHVIGGIRFSFNSSNQYNSVIKPYWNSPSDTRLSFGISPTEGDVPLETFHVMGNGNIGIRNSEPHAPLQFENVGGNRKIILFEQGNNDNEFYGFGISTSTLRYQTNGGNHTFFSGISSTSSRQLFNIKDNGTISHCNLTTAQINSLTGMSPGDLAYNSDLNMFVYWNSIVWKKLHDNSNM